FPKFMQHIPWKTRSRRQKVIIVTFYLLVLILMASIAGSFAILFVYVNNEKFVCRHTETQTIDSEESSTNNSLT
ncbi:hypothetical protein KR026_007666, partial [Drosophila bipectinata]